MSESLRISFGIIVLNGEPFTRYCLRSIYPYAHEIIVVEGGHEDTRCVTTPDGHSIDDTLAALYRFKTEEDPKNKVKIITREGHWPKKDELGRDRTPQSRIYAEQATGDYLWQIDIDEFYKPEDIEEIIRLLENDRSITTISFPQITFWGDINYSADSWALRRNKSGWHRIFKWGKGYKYITHEPPTIFDDAGRDLKTLNWLDGQIMKAKGIFMYHYSILFPWQIKQKTMIYHDEKPDYCAEILSWAEKNYFGLSSPYRVHNIYRMPSWLERYQGTHPPVIYQMMADIQSGVVHADQRQTDDIEAMISTWWYPLGRDFYKVMDYLERGEIRSRQWMAKVYKQSLRKVISPISLTRK